MGHIPESGRQWPAATWAGYCSLRQSSTLIQSGHRLSVHSVRQLPQRLTHRNLLPVVTVPVETHRLYPITSSDWLKQSQTGEAGELGWGRGQEPGGPSPELTPFLPHVTLGNRAQGMGGHPADLTWVTCHQEDPAIKRGESPRKIGVLLPQKQSKLLSHQENTSVHSAAPGHGGRGSVHISSWGRRDTQTGGRLRCSWDSGSAPFETWVLPCPVSPAPVHG